MSSNLSLHPDLVLRWIAELVRHPTIVGAVEDLIGPNVLCWSSSFLRGTFIKQHTTNFKGLYVSLLGGKWLLDETFGLSAGGGSGQHDE